MIDKLSLKTLIWIDAIAALSSGLFVLSFKSELAPWFQLPYSLLSIQSTIALTYFVYSLNLALREHKSLLLLKVLITANFGYSLFCLFLIVKFAFDCSIYGLAFLILDAVLVALLALLESRQLNKQAVQ